MMKRDKNFKMSKRTKTMIALMPFKSQNDRDTFKNIMIDAQLAGSVSVKTKKE
jgi:hypothetical protein